MQQIVSNEISNGLNVLIVGNLIPKIAESKYLNKLYITSSEEYKGAINITFNTFRELAQKCKALQIDIVVAENEKWILEGIGDVLKSNFINCIAPAIEWTNLKLSNEFARNLLEKYEISIPKLITLPVDFPLIVRSNRFVQKVNSLEELIKLRETISEKSQEMNENTHLEEFLEGEKLVLSGIFDGKTLISLPNDKIDRTVSEEYFKKLENLLIKENANFIGFINSTCKPLIHIHNLIFLTR